jgi:hypothetical protein
MKNQPAKDRRLVLAGGLAATVAAAALAFLPAAIGSADGNSPSSTGSTNLFAYVMPTSRGPLTSCSGGSDCTTANEVWHFIYVANENRLQNFTGFSTRATLQNSFVVGSVDLVGVFVNGVLLPDSPLRFTPPPDTGPFLGGSGHWPATVTCGEPGAFQRPCNVVKNPAVVPGERTAVFYAGWIHVNTEANGTYVFKYTVHGTLNGAPVDLTARSPSILMTN